MNRTNTLLALHTATDVCSVSLLMGGVVHSRASERPRAHAEQLVPLMQELLADVLADPSGSSLDGIVVAAGPGSFTGLRIGVATAKGLAWAHDIPLFAVSTLAGYAAQALKTGAEGPIAALLQARRGELYAGIYGDDFGPMSGDMLVPSDKLASWHTEYVTSGVTYSGPDVERILEADPELHAARYVRTSSEAESLLELVLTQPHSFLVDNVSAFEPYYLKSFVARRPSGSIFDRLSI